MSSHKLVSGILSVASSCVLAVGAWASPEPGINIYHVGIDNLPTISRGTYAGQANPNYNRLTMLLSHTFTDNPLSNHFHRIGAYVLSGPVDTPIITLSTNNRLPEPYQLDDGLSLLPGSGAFDGKYISGLGPASFPSDDVEQEYGDLTIKPIDNLLPYDGRFADAGDTRATMHPGHYLVNASSGVYKGSIANTTVGLKLTALSDGLSVHNSAGSVLFNALNETVTLGTGAAWSLLPVFAVDDDATPGTQFSATFQLVDLSGSPTYGDSAPFSVDFVVIPEPASFVVLSAGIGALAMRRRRNA